MNSKTIELTPERFARAESIFDTAVDLAAGERERYLDEQCGDDPELLEYVRALLDQNADPDPAVAATIAGAAARAFGSGDSIDGELIGPYRVERMIGSGGMGMVYLARRADEQFDQEVAIKLGRHSLVDPQTELRLRNERQILSDLDHPNIAKLFDGGTMPDGVPYLVMEYIDGVRIDTYCDCHRLSIADRLELFRTICAAVHYAHQNLVVHRDIKASNILVTESGTPKLLDFGIAKLIDTQGAATDGLTRENTVVMTPENAAPEQILGQTVTTATDTYALGLLLYQLLTGLRALPIDNLTPGEFAHIVCEQDVLRPSQKLASRLGAARREGGDALHQVEALGRDRGTGVERLVRRLRGDLDTIVLNALRKEPERRYPSVLGLANDIDLHMKSMPIRARADSARYRAGKFVKRHYAAVSVAAAMVLMLAGFAVTVSVQNQRIAAERDRAREVSQFLEDVFTAPDPTLTNGAEITARELLDVGANRIRSGLGHSPEIQSELMGTIGRVYFNLSLYEPSAGMLESALELTTRRFGAGHPSVAAAENDLARSLTRRAEYDRARELLDSALRTSLAAHGEDSAEVAAILNNMAELDLQTGNLDGAEELATRSIDIYSALGGDHAMDLATTKASLARILQVRGDLERTEQLLREAIAIVEAQDGTHDASLAYYQQNLGVLLRTRGDFEAAEAVVEESIRTTRRVFGDSHALLAAALMDQGTLLHLNGELDAAERVMREALALNIRNRGVEHPFVGVDKILLGMLLHDKGDIVAAEDMLRDALALYESTPDPDNQYTASALTELGAVLATSGRLDEALGLLDRAVTIREKDYEPGNALLAATQAEYADVLTRLGRYERAEALLTESVAVLGDRPGRRAERAYAALERLQSAREK